MSLNFMSKAYLFFCAPASSTCPSRFFHRVYNWIRDRLWGLWTSCLATFSFGGSRPVWVKPDGKLKSMVTGFSDLMGSQDRWSRHSSFFSHCLYFHLRASLVLVTNPYYLSFEGCHIFSWGNINNSQSSSVNTQHFYLSDFTFLGIFIFIVVYKLEHA